MKSDPNRSLRLALFVLSTACVMLPCRRGLTDDPKQIAAEQTRKSPNVLLIMADDLGYSDLGCYGSEIQTPNLDSLASNGLRFTQFYNTARCWPTRAALLTGYYPQQVNRDALPGKGGGGGNRNARPIWARLLPDMLRPAGYRSYHSGKWHIDGMPIQHGFDRSYLLKDQGRFFNPEVHWEDDQKLPAVEKDSGYYGTTAIADHAIKCLQEHQQKPLRQTVLPIILHSPHRTFRCTHCLRISRSTRTGIWKAGPGSGSKDGIDSTKPACLMYGCRR